MATLNISNIPDDLLADLQARADAAGKSVEELALDTLRAGLKEKHWQDMFSFNKRPPMSDDAIVEAVHDYRAGR